MSCCATPAVRTARNVEAHLGREQDDTVTIASVVDVHDFPKFRSKRNRELPPKVHMSRMKYCRNCRHVFSIDLAPMAGAVEMK